MIARRSFLFGLIAAPVIVRASSLMPVRVMVPTPLDLFDYTIIPPALPDWAVGIVTSVERTPKGLIATIQLGRHGSIYRVKTFDDHKLETGGLVMPDENGEFRRVVIKPYEPDYEP